MKKSQIIENSKYIEIFRFREHLKKIDKTIKITIQFEKIDDIIRNYLKIAIL